jgi:Ser/Thr protein kinase RdoA (MazF antagonist)
LQPADRAKFDAAELAVVLSHYDLGIIESVTEFPRGSRRSPKVGVVCEKGKFLLKRRSARRAEPHRVQLVHALQAHLSGNGFPIARIIPTRDRKHSFVQQRESVYELFEFVAGQPYERTKEETYDAGRVLAQFHQATENFHSPHALPVPHGDFHDAPSVRTGLCAIGSTLSSHDSFSGDEAELATLVQFLLETYDRAAEIANSLRLTGRPDRIIHSDWHPGNVLYRKQRVAAVVDYDSVRLAKRVLDIANGALQFSMIAGGDPATWPPNLDEERYDAFLSGYESLLPIDDAERACIPPLMTEALIAECVPPITETGSVGQWAGFRVLLMVRRKLRWIMANAPRLGSPLSEPRP